MFSARTCYGLAGTHVKRSTLLCIVQMLELCDEVVLVQLLHQRSQVSDASKELFSLGCLRCRFSDVCVITRAPGYVIRLCSTAVIRRCRLRSTVVIRRFGFTCTFQGIVDEMNLRFLRLQMLHKVRHSCGIKPQRRFELAERAAPFGSSRLSSTVGGTFVLVLEFILGVVLSISSV